jgi:hypothetical protein
MKKFFILLSVICASATVQAQSDKEPYLTKSLTSESIKNVKVETSGGSIMVAGVSSDAKIEMYVTANNGITGLSKDEIKKRLEEYYTVRINAEGGTLTAVAKNKEDDMNWKKGLNISFKIYVPVDASSDLNTSGGSISLNNLKGGNQEFRTSGGSLHVADVSGKINGRTSGGSIHVSNAQDEVDLSTSGGSIEAKNCKGNLKLSTSGGSLNLADLDGTIDASTSGGHIEGNNIRGELSASTSGGSVKLSDIHASLETSTSGGNMDIEVVELGKYVKVSNSGGSIDLTLPANKGYDLSLHGNKIKTDQLKNFSGSVDDNSVDGKLNGGGTEVKVHASSGHVNLSFR